MLFQTSVVQQFCTMQCLECSLAKEFMPYGHLNWYWYPFMYFTIFTAVLVKNGHGSEPRMTGDVISQIEVSDPYTVTFCV